MPKDTQSSSYALCSILWGNRQLKHTQMCGALVDGDIQSCIWMYTKRAMSNSFVSLHDEARAQRRRVAGEPTCEDRVGFQIKFGDSCSEIEPQSAAPSILKKCSTSKRVLLEPVQRTMR